MAVSTPSTAAPKLDSAGQSQELRDLHGHHLRFQRRGASDGNRHRRRVYLDQLGLQRPMRLPAFHSHSRILSV